MKPMILMLCALLTSYNIAARNLDDVLKTGTLRVGTTGDYKPFTYQQNNQYAGFDIETAQALADKPVKLELVSTSWPTLMTDLKGKLFPLKTVNDI